MRTCRLRGLRGSRAPQNPFPGSGSSRAPPTCAVEHGASEACGSLSWGWVLSTGDQVTGCHALPEGEIQGLGGWGAQGAQATPACLLQAPLSLPALGTPGGSGSRGQKAVLSPLQMHVGPRALVSTRLLGRELPSSTFSLEPERQEPLASEGRVQTAAWKGAWQRNRGGSVLSSSSQETTGSEGWEAQSPGSSSRPGQMPQQRSQVAELPHVSPGHLRGAAGGRAFPCPVRSLQHRDPPVALVVEKGLLPRELRLVGGWARQAWLSRHRCPPLGVGHERCTGD